MRGRRSGILMRRDHEHDNEIIALFDKLNHVAMNEWDSDFFKKLQNSWQHLRISPKQFAYLQKLHWKYVQSEDESIFYE